MKLKRIFSVGLKALVLTMFLSAGFHMFLLIILSIVHGDIKYLNPLSFLGITILRPDLKDSEFWLFMGWAFLVLLFLIMIWVILNAWVIAEYFYKTKTAQRWLAMLEKLTLAKDKASSTAKKFGVKIK
jgi:hypothetical protein